MRIKVTFIKVLLYVVLVTMPFQGLIAQDNVIDRVEWVVGDKSILRSDIEEAIRYWVASGRTFEGDPYCVVGEDLAVQQLFLHQAAIDSIEVDEGNIIRQVEMQMEYVMQQIGSKEKMEEYFNMTSSDIREMYREQLYNKEMADRMKMKIVGDVKASPLLVRRYMESLPKDSIPFIQRQVEVQIITMQPQIDQEEIERVKGELREYTERVMSGETSFSTLALMYSQDPGSARSGGELGFMGRGQLQPEFSAVAFNLTDPAKVSKIVETEYGFHIIQLIEKRGDKVNVRHILRKPEHSSENLKAAFLRLDSLVTGIKENEISFDDAAGLYSDDKDTRNNFGIMYNKQNASSHFGMDELPVDVARVVESLQVGEISQPFAWLLDNGKTVCAIAKVKSRTDAHQATFSEDYEVLRQMYEDKLSNDKIKEWIKKKQRSTFVRVNKDGRSCEFLYPDWNFYEE